MITIKKAKLLAFFILASILLNSCNGKLPGGDARKTPADPAERVKRNLAEGRGFKLMDMTNQNKEEGFLILQAPMNFGEPLWM